MIIKIWDQNYDLFESEWTNKTWNMWSFDIRLLDDAINNMDNLSLLYHICAVIYEQIVSDQNKVHSSQV